MGNQLQREYENMLDTLTRCQQECTRLLLENRALKDKFRISQESLTGQIGNQGSL